VKPKVIVTLGNVATQALLSTKEGIRTLRTNVFDLAGIPVLPTLHPAAALRGGAKVVEELRSDLLRVKAYL
jgi:DNA polymerase